MCYNNCIEREVNKVSIPDQKFVVALLKVIEKMIKENNPEVLSVIDTYIKELKG